MGKQHSECSLCGKTIVDAQESSVLKEVVGGISYNFDTNQCIMMYKRLRSVYGDDKFLAPQEQFVSDHFWNRAIPTEQEIKEIEIDAMLHDSLRVLVYANSKQLARSFD
jgi:hypothetical protein